MVLRDRLNAQDAKHAALHLGVTAARGEAEKARTDATDKAEKWARLKAELKARDTLTLTPTLALPHNRICTRLLTAEQGPLGPKSKTGTASAWPLPLPLPRLLPTQPITPTHNPRLNHNQARNSQCTDLREAGNASEAEKRQRMAQALLDAEKAEAIIAKLRADKLLLVAQLAAMRTRAEEAEAALRAGGMGMGMRERAERAEATCITLQEELDARPPRAADGCSLCCGPDRNVLVIDRRELLSL